MRVMLLTNLPRAHGGLEVFTSHLTCALGDEFDFVIAGCAEDGPQHRFLLPHKARVRHIATRWQSSSPGRTGRIKDIAFALRNLDACLRSERPDVIVLQATDLWHPLLSALSLAGRVHARIVIAFHIPASVIFARLRPAARWLVRCALHRADRVVGVSAGLIRDVARDYGVPANRLRVLYNPVPRPRISALDVKRSEQPTLPSILHVARIDPIQKNQKLLLLAFAKVLEQMDARLDIVGPGQPDAELRALLARPDLADRVHLHGFQSNPAAWMARASLLVLSSNYEGFAYVLVEALAAGCPVVSTDCPHGPRELLGDDEYGLLTPPGDVVALANAMSRVLKDAPLRERLIANGRERAQDFSLERGIARYRLLFDELAPRSRHSARANAKRAAGSNSGSLMGSEHALSEQK